MFKESDKIIRLHQRFKFSEASSDDVRKWCFEEELNPIWNRPGHGLVSRKICLLIRRRVYPNSPLDLQDLFQEIFTQIWDNLDKIEESFRKSGRPQTWSNFEKWLHISIDHRLLDMIRSQIRLQQHECGPLFDDELEAEEQCLPDSDRDRVLKNWYGQALAVLEPLERDLLVGRLVNRQSIDELAATHGVTKDVIYHKLYEAKQKFRNEMIRLVAVNFMTRHPDEKAQFQLVIINRCKLGKPCYMYRVDCPKARSPEILAREYIQEMSSLDVEQRVQRLKRLIESLLDEWDLGNIMDRCFWAVK